MVRPLRVGIMSYRQRQGAFPFAEGAYFKGLIRAARSLSMQAFVFCPLDVDWVGRSIHGYTCRPQTGVWVSRQYPFPDVVYDRLFPPSGPMYQAMFNAKRRLLRQRGVRSFGRVLNGKWEVYRALGRTDLSYSVPETYPLNVRSLRLLLGRHKFVFVKPDVGSQGKGILKVTRTSQGLHCQGRDLNNRQYSVTARSLPEVVNIAFHNSKRRRLLAQQGLSLNHFRGSTFDVRAVVQKNESGEWQLTGSAARVGRRGSITSNLHGGGRALHTDRVIKDLFPEEAEKIMTEIGELAVKIPAALDQQLGRFGELGLDFGVDTQGKVWLIEANSKPGRTVFLRIRERELRRNSILRPMQYAKFLAQRRNPGV